MKVPGRTMDDHLAEVSRRMPADDVMVVEMAPCEADVIASEVFLDFRAKTDVEHPMRPYLHFMGECRAIRGELPFGRTELAFEEGKGIPVDLFYEFTNEEIANMSLKGLFDRGFKCPEIFYNNVLEMPVACNFRIIEPKLEGEPPIVFADIADRYGIEVSEETCGYRFGDYFEQAFVDETELDFDDFEYDDWDREDVFAEDYIEPEVETEEEYVPSEDELRIAAHVDNVAKRVKEDHVDVPRAKMHKVLQPLPEDEKQDVHVDENQVAAEVVAAAEEPAFDMGVETEVAAVDISDDFDDVTFDDEPTIDEPVKAEPVDETGIDEFLDEDVPAEDEPAVSDEDFIDDFDDVDFSDEAEARVETEVRREDRASDLVKEIEADEQHERRMPSNLGDIKPIDNEKTGDYAE